MKVLFAASECAPFVKSGGLGDIMGALPGVINGYGADARVILPKYSKIPKEFSDKMKHIEFFEVELGWRKLYCGILELEHEGVHYYFVDNEYFFKRPEPVSYTHLRAHETRHDLVCRLLLEKKKKKIQR